RRARAAAPAGCVDWRRWPFVCESVIARSLPSIALPSLAPSGIIADPTTVSQHSPDPDHSPMRCSPPAVLPRVASAPPDGAPWGHDHFAEADDVLRRG